MSGVGRTFNIQCCVDSYKFTFWFVALQISRPPVYSRSCDASVNLKEACHSTTPFRIKHINVDSLSTCGTLISHPQSPNLWIIDTNAQEPEWIKPKVCIMWHISKRWYDTICSLLRCYMIFFVILLTRCKIPLSWVVEECNRTHHCSSGAVMHRAYIQWSVCCQSVWADLVEILVPGATQHRTAQCKLKRHSCHTVVYTLFTVLHRSTARISYQSLCLLIHTSTATASSDHVTEIWCTEGGIFRQ